jgi:hypothetical protein
VCAIIRRANFRSRFLSNACKFAFVFNKWHGQLATGREVSSSLRYCVRNHESVTFCRKNIAKWWICFVECKKILRFYNDLSFKLSLLNIFKQISVTISQKQKMPFDTVLQLGNWNEEKFACVICVMATFCNQLKYDITFCFLLIGISIIASISARK